MTATLPATATRTAAHRAPRPAGPVSRRALNTPTALRALLAGLVLLSLAWGAFGGWVATQHSSAADSLVSTDERLSLEAREMFQSIGDADATITAAFLASPRPPLGQLQRYESDLATAHRDLSGLQAAGGSQADASALARLDAGLSAYSGYVAETTAEYAMGYPLTGGSFLQDASGEAHLVLLPAANTAFTQENDALAAGFLTARSDLDGGIAHGSGPVQNLALASIGVQQIRGDAVLNVISRSGSTSFQTDFLATSKRVGPGNGSLLGLAAAAQQAGGQGAALVATAQRDATAWYAANDQVYLLNSKANYAAERGLIVGSGAGSTATAYTALEGDITSAIRADQGVFDSAATEGANALDPLAGVVIATSLLMAAGCAWAVSRRLAEYR
jgi:hypothetical protein